MKSSLSFGLVAFLSFAVAPSVASLRRLQADQAIKYYEGTSADLGNGRITAFTRATGKVPVEVGVTFTKSTLENLPSAPSDGRWDIVNAAGEVSWYCCGHESIVYFSDQVELPFKHFVANYNPTGHPPMPYSVPHFDMHFYLISNEIRETCVRLLPPKTLVKIQHPTACLVKVSPF